MALAARSLTQFAAARLGYFVVAVAVILFSLSVDRSDLLDQGEYVDYFVNSPTLDWLEAFTDAANPLYGIVALFTEEIVWLLWTTVVGALLDPAVAVLFTVLVLNVLIVLALARLQHSLLALMLWAFLPVGLVVVGLVQMRQGFAYAVFLWLALSWRRPLTGLVLASLIHTTFAVPLACLMIVRVLRLGPVAGALVSSAVISAAALAGGVLFDLLGGRRLLTYSPDEGANSIFFVIAAGLLVLPSLWWLLEAKADDAGQPDRVIESCALIHVGVTTFVVVSFFVFPLGTARIAYYTQLLLVPVLASSRFSGLSLAFATGPAMIGLAYWVGKAFVDGSFAHALSL